MEVPALPISQLEPALCVCAQPLGAASLPIGVFCAAPRKKSLITREFNRIIEPFRPEKVFKIIESNPKITCRKLWNQGGNKLVQKELCPVVAHTQTRPEELKDQELL